SSDTDAYEFMTRRVIPPNPESNFSASETLRLVDGLSVRRTNNVLVAAASTYPSHIELAIAQWARSDRRLSAERAIRIAPETGLVSDLALAICRTGELSISAALSRPRDVLLLGVAAPLADRFMRRDENSSKLAGTGLRKPLVLRGLTATDHSRFE